MTKREANLASALQACLSAMYMQEKRETEEFHIPQRSAWQIWSDAKNSATATLAQVGLKPL
jgi:hypothetical protein